MVKYIRGDIMKDTRKELFHTYVEAKTEKISYPYLEKYKVREADADIIKGQKSATSHLKQMSNKVIKRFCALGIPGFLITIFLVALGSVIKDKDTGITVILTGAILGVGIVFYAIRRLIKEMKSEEYVGAKERVISFSDSIAFHLGAPADAKSVDIITPVQKKKLDGSLGFSVTRKNITYKIFKKGEDVYVIASFYLFVLPLSEFKSLIINPKATTFQNWDKKESYTSETYKPYKIGYNSQSYTYFVKNTSELVFCLDGEDYKTIIMPWSTKIIEDILEITSTYPEKKENKK